MNNEQLISHYDEMHGALLKLQGLAGLLMGYKSMDHLPDTEVRHLAWLIHGICADAIKGSGD